MVAARNKNEAKLKTIHALAAYYPDIRVSDFMMTFKKDEAEVLV